MRVIVAVLLGALLAGCGYNRIQQKDEAMDGSWSEVLNQYQRRADLIPNLVSTVKGFAAQEQAVLLGVTRARAQVGQINVDVTDAASLRKFQAAQGALSGALSWLMAVAENYPELKSDAIFLRLSAQLEGSENRIAVARRRYILAVQDYNTFVRSFPQNQTARMFGYSTRPNFAVEDEAAISRPPTVDFDAARPQPAPAQ